MSLGAIVQIHVDEGSARPLGRAFWGGSSVKDLVFEIVLIASLVVPVIATSMQPIRAMGVNRTPSFKKLRRRG